MDEFSNGTSENFDRIRQRASSYGYDINYGRVVDNRSSDNNSLGKIIVAGVIVIGGVIYLKHKLKKLFKDIFGEKEKKEEVNITEQASVKFSSNDNNPKEKKSFRIYGNNFDKSSAIDVEYTVKDLYDSDHPDNIQDRNYSCQFTKGWYKK